MKYFLILFLILLCCFNKAKADEVNCLALNIYHEARNQPTVGKLAVAQVTMNRVKDVRFPNTSTRCHTLSCHLCNALLG